MSQTDSQPPTPPNAPTASERCALRHPGMDVQCGLPKGHRGEHTTEIPNMMPWATHGDGEKTAPVEDKDLEQWFRELEDDNWGDAVAAIRAALLAARRGERALRDALDAVYVERYGITYQELEQRIRDVQNGEFLTHEEAMQRIRAALAAAQGEK